MIESLDDDVFEFVAEELLDCAFVLLLDFRVIGEDSDGAEAARIGFAIHGEKFLHRFGGVRAVIENLFERAAASAFGGEIIAHFFVALSDFLMRAAGCRQGLLSVANLFSELERVCFGFAMAGFGCLNLFGLGCTLGFEAR